MVCGSMQAEFENGTTSQKSPRRPLPANAHWRPWASVTRVQLETTPAMRSWPGLRGSGRVIKSSQAVAL